MSSVRKRAWNRDELRRGEEDQRSAKKKHTVTTGERQDKREGTSAAVAKKVRRCWKGGGLTRIGKTRERETSPRYAWP